MAAPAYASAPEPTPTPTPEPVPRRRRLLAVPDDAGVLTDALSSVILQSRVLPKFKSGDMSGGIVAGTDAILEQLLLDTPAAKARVAEAEKQVKNQDSDDPFTAIFVFIVIMIVVGSIFRRGGRGGLGVLPWIILGSMGGRGGWGDGGGFGGGGGFSGGGGSFGGGGSSGSW